MAVRRLTADRGVWDTWPFVNPFRMKDRQSIAYLVRSATGYLSAVECPSCGSSDAALLERKYIVTRLFECTTCRLRFRHPRESPFRLRRFYESDYSQDDGITTEMPDPEGLQGLIESGFGEKNSDHYAEAFRILMPELRPEALRMTDYGCSWGYQTHQFRSCGIDCVGFELSATRAAYGRRVLGLPIVTDPREIPFDNHVFFSSHVVEHLPSPSEFIRFAMERIRRDGYFVAETPNGSESHRRKAPSQFSRLWGRVHPNMLHEAYYLEAFKGMPLFMTSQPPEALPDAIRAWDRNSTRILDLSGPNLILFVKKTH